MRARPKLDEWDAAAGELLDTLPPPKCAERGETSETSFDEPPPGRCAER